MKLKSTLTIAILAATYVPVTIAASTQNVKEINFEGIISTSSCDFTLSENGSSIDTVDFGLFETSDIQGANSVFGTQKTITITPDSGCSSTFSNGAEIRLTSPDLYADNSIIKDNRNSSAGVQVKVGTNNWIGTGFQSIQSSDTFFDETTGSVSITAQPYATAASLQPGQFGGKLIFQIAYK
ncbi:hypothetical protein P7M77_03060 [Vibrio parahaemolyticus]|nr:hypothetical protein [Vibrio parahaemolyticus]MDG2729012.1 hypothetical protein [Vibrio parahaemolyticus]HBC3391091.1 type 1 fimbrial protein [Vibrio parahaemolyticus]HBC3577904.1 type 1 fimbrial protein [Vibrio parahaemolyticus]HBC3947638.1 type 1 fimbrial protein [Vibrio parahaemolyticus]